MPRPAARAAALKAVLEQEDKGLRKPPVEATVPEEDVAAEEDRVKELLLQRTGEWVSDLRFTGYIVMLWVEAGHSLMLSAI
jgi:hypothetical protein